MSDLGTPSPRPSFGQVFSAAVRNQSLTLERLSAHLERSGTPVTTAALSYWQTGRSVPTRESSRRAVVELEKLLAVTPGTLLNALPGDPDSAWSPVEALGIAPEAVERVRNAGVGLERSYTTHLLHDTVDLSGEQAQLRRLVILSADEQLQTLQTWFVIEADELLSPRVVQGGALAGEPAPIDLRDGRFLVPFVVELTTTLQRGELWSVEVGFILPSPPERMLTAVTHPYRHLVMDVVFGDGAAPTHVHHRAPGDGGDDEPSEVPVWSGQCQLSREEAPAGSYQLAWGDLVNER